MCKKVSRAGYFDSDKTSEEKCEGVYIRYMTEQFDEVGAVRIERDKRKWLSGRASPCQGEGREFESRLPLFKQQRYRLIRSR